MWRASEIRWPCLALIVIVIGIGMRPGDSAWYFDMSRDFNLALQFNDAGKPSTFALKGTHGIRYGPLPVWIDQAFLLFTHNLLVMSAIRAVAVGGLTAIGLLWLTQVLRLNPWLAVLTMLSPWIWYYSRQLWDNSLTVPTTALLLASYLQFIDGKRAWAICLTIVCAALTALVHLIVAPFLIVLLVHALVFERPAIWKCKWSLFVTLAAMLLISTPYLHYIFTFHGAAVPVDSSRWKGWVFPLLSAQHLTGRQIGYFLDEDLDLIRPAFLRYAFLVARLFTYIGFIACWLGMFVGIQRARRAMSRQGDVKTIDHFCLIGLGTFIIQTIFDGIQHVFYHPHYYNTTWMVFVVFAWMTLDALPRWFGARSFVAILTLPVYAACLIFIEAIVAWQIARNGGTKTDHYDAVLSNQIEVAEEIDRFSDQSPIDMQVPYWVERKDTLPVICRIVGPQRSDLPLRRLVVRFRDAFPGDSRIVVDNYPISSELATRP